MAKYIIEGRHPLNGTVTPSGNKNEALPALMACILTDDPVTLQRVPRIQDVLTTVKVLESLGVETKWEASDTLTLCAKNIHSFSPDKELCERIRASILLIGPLLARFGEIHLPLPGGDVIGARRVDTHFEAVKGLGGELLLDDEIHGTIKKIKGDDIFLDEPSVTATENALLLAVLCEGETILHNAASEPHVVGLCKLLNAMGAKISGIGSNQLTIKGVRKLHGAVHTLGPDFMEIGSFLCLGAMNPGTITIDQIEPTDLRFILKTLAKLGIHPEVQEKKLVITGSNEPTKMLKDISGRIASIYSGPWPSYPTDLMSVAIVCATQAQGTIIFHEKMFEGRMFFTDKLMAMGANIVLCDPHRIVVTGPQELRASRMSSPDVRAGMALLMASLVAHGKSVIDNIYQIERGYCDILSKLISLGAQITRTEH